MKHIAKKLVALLLAVLFVVSLAACGSKETPASNETPANSSAKADSGAKKGSDAKASSGSEAAPVSARDTLNIAIAQDNGTLHPLKVTGSGGFQALAFQYMEPLLQTMQGRERVWILATGIDKVSDTQFTIHLREGVTFSNGNPFTAEDVIFTFDAYSKDSSRAMYVQSIDVPNCKVIDDYTVDMRYSQFNVVQETMLGSVLMLDKESYDEDAMAQNPIGTGPYVVTDYVVNSHVKMQARDDYWGGKPAIEYLNCIVLNESAQVTNALETGMVDLAKVPLADADYVESLGKYSFDTYSLGRGNAIFFNMSPDSALASKEARYAVCYAIDSEAIINVAYSGFGQVCDWPGSNGLVDFDPSFAGMTDIYADSFNMEKAKENAEKSGLVGKTLTLITNGAEDFVTTAQMIQSNLKDIGVNVDIKNYDQASFYGLISDVTNFDLALYITSAPTTSGADIFGSYPMFFNCGWEGDDREAYMELGREVLAIADDAPRSAKLKEMTKMQEEFCPWYAYAESLTINAFENSIQGMNTTVNGVVFYSKLSFAP